MLVTFCKISFLSSLAATFFFFFASMKFLQLALSFLCFQHLKT